MEDQELWDLMGDLEDVGLGDSLTKAYLVTGFYEGEEKHLENEIFTGSLLNGFIEDNKADGVDLFSDYLTEPKSPHIDPLVSSLMVITDKYLIIKGDFTKVRSVEERLRKDFVIEKEIELKDYKKFEPNGTSGYYGYGGSTGVTGYAGSAGISGVTGSAGTTAVVYSSTGIGGSWSTSGIIISSSKTASASSSVPIMIQRSLKIEMPINDLKDPGGTEVVESYGHPLWAKIKTKFNRIL
jgi:hypothetical protein